VCAAIVIEKVTEWDAREADLAREEVVASFLRSLLVLRPFEVSSLLRFISGLVFGTLRSEPLS